MPIKDNYSAATSKFFAVLPLRNSAGHKSFLPFLKIQAATPAPRQRPPLLYKDFEELKKEIDKDYTVPSISSRACPNTVFT